MRLLSRKAQSVLIASIILIILSIFAVDLLTPVGFVAWLLYLFPILVTCRTLNRRTIFTVTSLCTLLMFAGLAASPPGVSLRYGLLNCLIGVLVFWSAALFYISHMRVEESLRVSEEKYRSIFDHAPFGIYQSTVDGRFTYVNPTMAAMFGYEIPRDLVAAASDAGTQLFVHANEQDAIANHALTSRDVVTREVECRRRNGEVFAARLHLRAVPGENGEVRFLEGFVEDITERAKAEHAKKRLEDQFQQAQKMEAVGHLAGGIAHDFNNILTAIVGYSNILANKIAVGNPLHDYIEQIIGASNKATVLTRSLLAFSRKQVINPLPVDIGQIVRDMKKLLERVIGEDIELVVRTAERDLIVYADVGQIEQVLMNLSTNARDAMPQGGTLTITTEEFNMDDGFIRQHHYGAVGAYAAITVADTGMGMDEKTQERIFDPFFTTKDVDRGTGLGLAMVYGTIKQHNGYVGVLSEPGRGTSFKIYLPLETVRTRAVERKESPAVYQGDETILLVEDETSVKRAVTAMLSELGYRVLEAADVDSAVELFRNNIGEIRLVISDVIMPRKTGKDLADSLRMIRSDVRLLFISGYTADVLKQRGIEYAQIPLLSKPLTPDTLSRTIREILEGRNQERADKPGISS